MKKMTRKQQANVGGGNTAIGIGNAGCGVGFTAVSQGNNPSGCANYGYVIRGGLCCAPVRPWQK